MRHTKPVADEQSGDDKERQERKATAYGCAIATCLVAAAIAATVLVVGGCDAQEEEHRRLSAAVQLGSDFVRIHNEDPYLWTEVEMSIDGVIKGYHYEHQAIGPGGTVDIPLREFVNKDGVRYDAQRWKPQEMFIAAWVPTEDTGVMATANDRVRGAWSGGW